jgi:hypothetical protein
MTEIVKVTTAQMDPISIGGVLAKSGYFSDARDAAQAAVKVMAGAELGIGPVAAMTGIYIVKGRVAMSANLMGSLIKRSGRYNYRVREMSNANVVIDFLEGKEVIGTSSFSEADAKAAGLWGSSDPWKKTPRNMLFARAMSNGAKWFCPDIFAGPVYTPDELGDEGATYQPAPVVTVVNTSTGEITGEIIDETPQRPAGEIEREGLLADLRQAYALAKRAGVDAASLPTKEHVIGASNDELRSILDTVRMMATSIED